MGIAGALNPLEILASADQKFATSTEGLNLMMTGYDYPRVEALYGNKVEIKGCTYEMEKSGGIGDMNTNAFKGPQKYDVTEIGMVPYILSFVNDSFRDYKLLPIFPLRMFRHKSIFVKKNSPIKSPEDLKGKRVGTTGYSSSSLTWIRGIIKDEYGVSPEDIEWVISNKDSSAEISGKISANEQLAPEGINITKGTVGKDESDLLLSGEVDALFHAAQPLAFVKGDPNIVRLFSNSQETEISYYKKTGIFPIMHAVAVKTSLIKEYPWLAESLFNAYSQAKEMNYAYINKAGWAYDILPWYGQEYERTKNAMGRNFYSYGYKKNKNILETLCRYVHEQGLSKSQASVEEMFFEEGYDLAEK